MDVPPPPVLHLSDRGTLDMMRTFNVATAICIARNAVSFTTRNVGAVLYWTCVHSAKRGWQITSPAAGSPKWSERQAKRLLVEKLEQMLLEIALKVVFLFVVYQPLAAALQ